MIEDSNNGISHLIEKEINSNDKILKPDFSQKTGRELLAFYLQTKFKQVLAFDSKLEKPLFVDVKYDFIQKFSKRLITNPDKRIMIGITGESASGKSTICKTIANVLKLDVFTPNGFRFTCGNLLVNGGMTVEEASIVLNHRTDAGSVLYEQKNMELIISKKNKIGI